MIKACNSFLSTSFYDKVATKACKSILNELFVRRLKEPLSMVVAVLAGPANLSISNF